MARGRPKKNTIPEHRYAEVVFDYTERYTSLYELAKKFACSVKEVRDVLTINNVYIRKQGRQVGSKPTLFLSPLDEEINYLGTE